MIIKERIYEPATCAACGGPQEITATSRSKMSCKVCGGKGHVAIEVPAEACPDCEGTGKGRGINLCYSCAGTGWQYYLKKRAA